MAELKILHNRLGIIDQIKVFYKHIIRFMDDDIVNRPISFLEL